MTKHQVPNTFRETQLPRSLEKNQPFMRKHMQERKQLQKSREKLYT